MKNLATNNNHIAQTFGRFRRDLFRIYRIQRFFVVELLLIFLASLILPWLEKSYLNANIRNFGDGIWWSIITVTSVGYGDKVPLSVGGKVIGSILAVSGVILFGITISLFSVYYSWRREDWERRKVLQKLDDISSNVSDLKKEVDYLVKK